MYKFILSFTICFLISTASLFSQHIYDLSQYGIRPNSDKNTSPLIEAAIKQIKTESNESDSIILKFEKGSYHFYEQGATQKEYYISNHDQTQPKYIGIDLTDFKHLTLDGNGSEFIFHGQMLPICLINSENCTLQNFQIDFEIPHIAQIQIKENKGNEGIIFETAPWVKYRVSDNKQFEIYDENWQYQPKYGIAFEETTKRIVYNTSDVSCVGNVVQEISPGILYAPEWISSQLIPGTVVALRSWARPTPGIFMSHDKNTILNNIQIHYAEGMGLLAQLCENITLDNFNVCLRGEDDPRYFTTQADATHFSSCKGQITSINGLYEGMMDDAINIHGTYLKVINRIDDYTLVGKYMHGQAYGFDWGYPGDSVQFVLSETMELIGSENCVASIQPYDQESIHGAKEFIIKFKEPLSENINQQVGIGIENLTWTPSVYFANNVIRNNRARGTLFSTPKETIVENNLFDHTSGTAILLCGDCNGWYETGACRNVIIRNNHFINALTNMFQFTNAIISIYPEIPQLEKQQQYFHGGKPESIIIENNTFEMFDEPILYAKSVDGLVFRNNTIHRNNDYPAFHWNKKPFLLERTQNVVIENNDFN